MDGVISPNWRSCDGDCGCKNGCKKVEELHVEDRNEYLTPEQSNAKRMMMLREL